MRQTRFAWIVLALLAGCNAPPPDAYVTASSSSQAGLSLGKDSTGAACVAQMRGAAEALVYCGDVRQPSARVVAEVGTGAPADLARASAWRAALNERLSCDAPVATTVFESSAVTMQCVRRIGGWPRVGLVAVVGGKTYYADADPSAVAPMQGAIGVLSGLVKPDSVATLPIAPGLAAAREANQAISSRDIGQYDDLMASGVRANLNDDYADAEAAFRQAARLQKPGNPARADPLMHQALQLSNMGRYAEAEAVFKQAADALAQTAHSGQGLVDPGLAPELDLYRALDLLNQKRAAEALPILTRAEQGYTAIIPPDQRVGQAPIATARGVGMEAMVSALAEQRLFQEPTTAAALLGLITTKRAEAVAYLQLKRLDDSTAAADAATTLAARHGMAQAALEARILRTNAMIEAAKGDDDRSLSLLTRSTAAFNLAFPASRPLAETELLRAANLLGQRRIEDGNQACRSATALLRRLKAQGVPIALMMPCLDLFAATAAGAKTPAEAQDTYAEMFTAAQLAQSGVTSAQIAQAATRLLEAQRNSQVGAAITRFQKAIADLDAQYRARDEMEARQHSGQPVSSAETASLSASITKAEAEEADAEAALQVASPTYGQLVQEVVTAKDVFAALHQGEALATMVLGADHGWTLLLRDGQITASRIDGGLPRMTALVGRIRASMAPGADGLPPAFDVAAAQELYTATLGGTSAALHGVTALVVAPTGPLLSIPFGLLLTGPAGSDLAKAPWLVQQMTVAHVPAPKNFIDLRRIAGGSRAPNPWIGFGDPEPVSLRQATASFPTADCASTARLFASLPDLQGARTELDRVREALGGAAQDEYVGGRFTMEGVLKAHLKNFRVLEFATHGLLPTDLACQNEAAIVTSPAPNARDAASALLTASRVVDLAPLDADTVILSACNTSGPNGLGSGESLSGLARSFFYAGARSLLVTHWAVNDQVTTILVSGTMRRYAQDPAAGVGAALVAEQRALLSQATGAISALAHPFYWAPLALIGDGGGKATTLAGSHTTLAGL